MQRTIVDRLIYFQYDMHSILKLIFTFIFIGLVFVGGKSW